jgi:putative ATP-grasp target RiPP
MLDRVNERFPLGPGPAAPTLRAKQPSDPRTRPFGLKFTTPLDVDVSKTAALTQVMYCSEVQMSKIRGQLYIAAGTKQTAYTSTEYTEDKQRFTDKDSEEVDG